MHDSGVNRELSPKANLKALTIEQNTFYCSLIRRILLLYGAVQVAIFTLCSRYDSRVVPQKRKPRIPPRLWSRWMKRSRRCTTRTRISTTCSSSSALRASARASRVRARPLADVFEHSDNSSPAPSRAHERQGRLAREGTAPPQHAHAPRRGLRRRRDAGEREGAAGCVSNCKYLDLQITYDFSHTGDHIIGLNTYNGI